MEHQGRLGDLAVQVESAFLPAAGPLHGQLGAGQIKADLVGPLADALQLELVVEGGDAAQGFRQRELTPAEAEEVQVEVGQGLGAGRTGLEVDRLQARLGQAQMGVLHAQGMDAVRRAQQGEEVGLDLQALHCEQVAPQVHIVEDQGAPARVELHPPDGEGQARLLLSQAVQVAQGPADHHGPRGQPGAAGEQRGPGHHGVAHPTNPAPAPEPLYSVFGGLPAHQFFSPQLGQTRVMRGICR